MQRLSTLHRFFPAACVFFAALALSSCDPKVGTWGGRPLPCSEFETFLEDQSGAFRANASFSEDNMRAAVYQALSNRVLAFEARRMGMHQDIAAFPGFSNELIGAIGHRLDLAWTPSERQLTVDLVRRHAGTWDTEAFYILGRTDGSRVPDEATKRTIARLENRVREATNLEALSAELRASEKVGYTRIRVGWTTAHWRFVPMAEKTPPGQVAGPIFQETGALYLRFAPLSIPSTAELNEAMKQSDFRKRICDAVRIRRVQEFREKLRVEGKSEAAALLSWRGDAPFREAMARFTNEFLAAHFTERLALRGHNPASISNTLTDLFNRHPLRVDTRAIPGTFTRSKKSPPGSEPPSGGGFLRALDHLLTPSAEARWEKGERALSDAVRLRRESSSLATNSAERARMEKRLAELGARADRFLAGAFVDGLSSHDRAWKTAMGFLQASDYLRAREWITRSITASGLRPEAVRALLLEDGDATPRLLLAEAMGLTGDEAWIPLLMELLAQARVPGDLLCFALEALGRLPDRGQAWYMEKFYRDPSAIWGVRFMASQALEKLTGRKYPVDNPGESKP